MNNCMNCNKPTLYCKECVKELTRIARESVLDQSDGKEWAKEELEKRYDLIK